MSNAPSMAKLCRVAFSFIGKNSILITITMPIMIIGSFVMMNTERPPEAVLAISEVTVSTQALPLVIASPEPPRPIQDPWPSTDQDWSSSISYFAPPPEPQVAAAESTGSSFIVLAEPRVTAVIEEIPLNPFSPGDVFLILSRFPDSPLLPYVKYIEEMGAKYDVDPRLIAAMSIRESTAGIHACGVFNAWGWRNCEHEPSFTSWENAIETVTSAWNVSPYAGLNTIGKLCMWKSGNGGCVNPGDLPYANDILGMFP